MQFQLGLGTGNEDELTKSNILLGRSAFLRFTAKRKNL